MVWQLYYINKSPRATDRGLPPAATAFRRRVALVWRARVASSHV